MKLLGYTTNFQLLEMFSKLNIPLVGIFNRDELLHSKRRNGFYLINMEASNDENGDGEQGSHWVCFYCDDYNALYFDAFGVIPPLEIMYFLKLHEVILYNKKQIQNIDDTSCGWYCLVWCHFIHHSDNKVKGMKEFNKRFKDYGHEENKKVLTKIIKHIL